MEDEALERQGANPREELEQANLRLRQSKAQLQRLTANVPGVIYQYVLGTDGSEAFTYVSPRCRDIYEVEPEELQQDVGLVWSMIHPADLERVHQVNLNSAQQLERVDIEFRLLPPSGSLRWVRAISQPERQANGDVIWDGLVLDITAQKETEAEAEQAQILVQQREQVYKTVVENSPDIIERFDLQLRHLYVSPFLEKVTGIPAKHFIGKTCREVGLPEAMVNLWATAVQTLSETGQNQTIEFETPTTDGLRCFEMQIAPELNQDGTIASFLCISRDITDRKQAEQHLQQISDALSNAVEGISRLDPQGRYLSVNDAYASMVGYTPAEMIGMNWPKTVHPEDLESVIAAYHQMLRTGKVEVEARGIRKDGSVFDKQLCMISAYDEHQQFIGHHCFMKDISERKRLEAENKQLEAQVLRTQRLESIGTLASGIAHDLNNILTPVLAVAQLLPIRLPEMDETMQRLLEILAINAKRGADLVQQILTFAGGSDGKYLTLQIGHLLAEIAKIVQETFPKSIEMRIQMATTDLWLVHADATQLHQVLMNLCVNARDAMLTGGTLTIAAENVQIDKSFVRLHLEAQVGNYVKITIGDTGSGISPEIYDRIFDPFFTTKELGKGTGLGLSTVRTIVKNHGGFIDVITQVGQGSSFQVYLPACQQAEAKPSTLPNPPEGNNELILLVDDEANIQQSIRILLETYHYQVLVAEDGMAAIAQYAQRPHDFRLVLVDLMMPTFDGFGVIEVLAKLNPQVNIIAMSGVASHQGRALASDRVQAFLTKPFTTQDLLTAITQVLVRS
ncbi:MAG: PAS domain S-box protein [Synechococcales bacterium]|nr:PAS domain S-box protein [Synechococcales bacterium]